MQCEIDTLTVATSKCYVARQVGTYHFSRMAIAIATETPSKRKAGGHSVQKNCCSVVCMQDIDTRRRTTDAPPAGGHRKPKNRAAEVNAVSKTAATRLLPRVTPAC